MPPLALLSIQIVFSFVAFTVLAFAVAPHLRSLPRARALELLLWVHVPRSIPLALLAPGQVGGVTAPVIHAIAWGDFASAVFALLGVVALRGRGARAIGWVWAFTVVSCIDIAVALTTGLGSGVYEHELGVGWYVLALYVPLVCVSQGMIGLALAKRLLGAGSSGAIERSLAGGRLPTAELPGSTQRG